MSNKKLTFGTIAILLLAGSLTSEKGRSFAIPPTLFYQQCFHTDVSSGQTIQLGFASRFEQCTEKFYDRIEVHHSSLVVIQTGSGNIISSEYKEHKLHDPDECLINVVIHNEDPNL